MIYLPIHTIYQLNNELFCYFNVINTAFFKMAGLTFYFYKKRNVFNKQLNHF